jgi:NAD(P)-dependent dehydrogenase (short-subunit alcohol dehydrogenase family)
MDIKNKVVLISGGGRGIGKATAKQFSREGARVVICSRNKMELNKTCDEIIEGGGECAAIECDIRNVLDIKNLIKKTLEKFNHIDIVINNAGTGYYKPIIETTEEEWDNTIDTNLKGIFLMCKETIPHIKNGIIINISSGAGKHGYPNFAAYCASKFGVIGFTESLSGELPLIKVYSLCFGPVDTKLFRDLFDYSPPKQPEDIANIITDLCKREFLTSGSSMDIP